MRVKPLKKAATIKLTLKESSWGKVGWLLARLHLMWIKYARLDPR